MFQAERQVQIHTVKIGTDIVGAYQPATASLLLRVVRRFEEVVLEVKLVVARTLDL